VSAIYTLIEHIFRRRPLFYDRAIFVSSVALEQRIVFTSGPNRPSAEIIATYGVYKKNTNRVGRKSSGLASVAIHRSLAVTVVLDKKFWIPDQLHYTRTKPRSWLVIKKRIASRANRVGLLPYCPCLFKWNISGFQTNCTTHWRRLDWWKKSNTYLSVV
jgi:hypothetical protein